jgi:hypothetical protein
MAVVAAAEQAEAFLAVMVMEKVVNQASQVAKAMVVIVMVVMVMGSGSLRTCNLSYPPPNFLIVC